MSSHVNAQDETAMTGYLLSAKAPRQNHNIYEN